MLLHNRLLGTRRSGEFVTLFLCHFDGTNGDPGPFLDEVPGITWTDDMDQGTATFTTTSKFGPTAMSVPPVISLTHTVMCGQFTHLNGKTWTVEGWVRLTAGANNTVVFFGVGNHAEDIAQATMYLRANLDLSVCDVVLSTFATGPIETSTAFVLTSGQYYHAAFSYDEPNGNYEVRFNGIREIISAQASIIGDDTDFMLTHTIDTAPVIFDEWRGVLGLPYTGTTYAVPTTAFTV